MLDKIKYYKPTGLLRKYWKQNKELRYIKRMFSNKYPQFNFYRAYTNYAKEEK